MIILLKLSELFLQAFSLQIVITLSFFQLMSIL